ncbi:hypothetical protein [Sphingomonas paucimobilis]|uniref:hypothetical protein n=1 Tax=Sphingomonas paucimobilis TaxID=13689 RepID=UPI001E2A7353|nr:hypothetical protein [Sphingomonas paucimobilis]
MHAIRSGIRGLAGASLIALGFAASPALAMASDAATPVGVPASGPILSGRIYDATGVALPGARVVVEGTGRRPPPISVASSASSRPKRPATSRCWSIISAARPSPASCPQPSGVGRSR